MEKDREEEEEAEEEVVVEEEGRREPRTSFREGRIFNPIVFLTKETTRLVFTTGVTTTQASSATVIFATCVPSDVSNIVGSTCG